MHRNDSKERHGPDSLAKSLAGQSRKSKLVLVEQQKIFAPVHLADIHWGLFVATLTEVIGFSGNNSSLLLDIAHRRSSTASTAEYDQEKGVAAVLAYALMLVTSP